MCHHVTINEAKTGLLELRRQGRCARIWDCKGEWQIVKCILVEGGTKHIHVVDVATVYLLLKVDAQFLQHCRVMGKWIDSGYKHHFVIVPQV